MKRRPLRAAAVITALAMTFSCLTVSAADEAAAGTATGSYSFTSNENPYINIQGEDTFNYRDDCFMRSSFEPCGHLVALSAQASLASASRYGEELDPDMNHDPSGNAQNILAMLEAMGFSDPETNKYYTLEKQENSCGVTVGHRKLSADGKDYTLLAIFPRSAWYKQEWAGNFNVGDGTVHEGFKEARDEVLRFVKSYMSEHSISGDLKVWIAGHSRGSAIANMLGGFFAGGGADYFGNISITPEDVYCLTYETPRTVLAAVDKAECFSVSGARGGVYENDTPGKAYTSPLTGTLDPTGKEFSGIHNYTQPVDFITQLPPPQWGYTYFGKVESLDADGQLTVDDMLAQLKTVSPYAYDLFVNGGGDFRSFEWKTFDFYSISLVTDTSEHAGNDMAYFVSHLIAGMTESVPDTDTFSTTPAFETFRALAGLYGMLHDFTVLDVEDNVDKLILPLAVSALAYSDERLQKEGASSSEAESAEIVIEQAIEFVTGEPVEHGTVTADDVVVLFSQLLYDHQDSKLYETVVSGLTELLEASEYSEILFQLLDCFVDDPDSYTSEEKLAAFLFALSQGPQEGTMARYLAEDAAGLRSFLYTMLMIAIPEASMIGSGEATLSELAEAVIPMLLTVKDEEGNVVKTYGSLTEASDEMLCEAIDLITAKPAQDTKRYGEQYYLQVQAHLTSLKANISTLRNLLLTILLHNDEGKFSIKTAVVNGATLVDNIMIIPAAHYNEVNVAWGKAMAAKGIGDHQPPESKEEKPDNSDTQKEESKPEPVNDDTSPATGRTSAAAAVVLITALAAIVLRRKH